MEEIEEKKYIIIPFVSIVGKNRFAIAEEGGEIVHDCFGYGHKTMLSAKKCLIWHFKGGQDRKIDRMIFVNNWMQENNIKIDKIKKVFDEVMLTYVEEFENNDMRLCEIWHLVDATLNIHIPRQVRYETYSDKSIFKKLDYPGCKKYYYRGFETFKK